MSNVFVVDTLKHPLTPVHPGQARRLLTRGKAAVYRTSPFTIILKREVEHPAPAPLRLKIDPGAHTTGLALVDDAGGEVIWAAELTHRGAAIKKALDTRRTVRRGRRSRKTRYRAPQFANRRRKAGWLPPSLVSRVENILTWVARISGIAHVSALSQELVRFDLQKLEHPDISGLEYQQGTLFGYEVREYCLEKWGRACAYCGATGIPLQLEHILARARGAASGSPTSLWPVKPAIWQKAPRIFETSSLMILCAWNTFSGKRRPRSKPRRPSMSRAGNSSSGSRRPVCPWKRGLEA